LSDGVWCSWVFHTIICSVRVQDTGCFSASSTCKNSEKSVPYVHIYYQGPVNRREFRTFLFKRRSFSASVRKNKGGGGLFNLKALIESNLNSQCPIYLLYQATVNGTFQNLGLFFNLHALARAD
jgi:hypothetical protein